MPKIKHLYTAPYFHVTGLQDQHSSLADGEYSQPLAFSAPLAQWVNARLLAERYGDLTLDAPTAGNPQPKTIRQILSLEDGTKATIDGPIREAFLLRPSRRMWDILAARSEPDRIVDAAFSSRLVSEQGGKPVHLDPGNPTAGLFIWNDHELHVAAVDPTRKERTTVVWAWRGNAGVDPVVAVPLASGFAKNQPDGRAVTPSDDMLATLKRKAGIVLDKVSYLGLDNTSNSWGIFPVADDNGGFHTGLLPAVQAVAYGVTGAFSATRRLISTAPDFGVIATNRGDLETLAAGGTIDALCWPSLAPKTGRMLERAREYAGGAGVLPFEAVWKAALDPRTKFNPLTDNEDPEDKTEHAYGLASEPVRVAMNAKHFSAVGHDFIPGALLTLRRTGVSLSHSGTAFVNANSTIGPINETLAKAWKTSTVKSPNLG